MDPSYEIVPYRPEYKPSILELQRYLWSPSLDLNRAYFEWKHEQNPYLTAPIVYLVLHQGIVVGMRGFFGVRWQAGLDGQFLPGLYADDLVIAPEHRNRGLIPRIMRTALPDLARMGYEFLFSLSAGAVTQVASLALGWHNAGSTEPWGLRHTLAPQHGLFRRMAIRAPAPLRRIGTIVADALEEDFRRLSDVDPARIAGQPLDGLSISFSLDPRVEEMAALVERVASSGRIRHQRDSAYLRWRFQNPLSRYGFLYCDGPELEGYLVLQEHTSPTADPNRLNIVDWEGATPFALEHLLDTACRFAGPRRIFRIWAASLSTERLAMLTKRGFRPNTSDSVAHPQTAVLVRSTVEGRPREQWTFSGRNLADLADWDLRMLYSMHA